MSNNIQYKRDLLIHFLQQYLLKKELKMKGLMRNLIKIIKGNKTISIKQFYAVIKFIEREEPFRDVNRKDIVNYFKPLIRNNMEEV